MKMARFLLKAMSALPVSDSPTVKVLGADGVEVEVPTQTRVVCSTQSQDRYGDIILQSGWDTDNFKVNPVIPFGHDYGQAPVGKALDIQVLEVDGKPALVATIQWDTSLARGLETARQFFQGFLNAVSVGLRMLDWQHRAQLAEDDPHHGMKGYLVRAAELMEVSVAVVPVLQDAVAIRSVVDESDPEPSPLTRSDVLDIIRTSLVDDLPVKTALRAILSHPVTVPLTVPPLPEPGDDVDLKTIALVNLLTHDED